MQDGPYLSAGSELRGRVAIGTAASQGSISVGVLHLQNHSHSIVPGGFDVTS
jgi:hypothetical protein